MARELSKIFPQIEVIESVDVTYEGKTYSVQWTDFYRQEDIGKPVNFPSILVIVDDEGNDLPPIYRDSDHTIKLLAIQHRFDELHEELGTDPITDMTQIQKILDRVWAGEWMGQFEFGRAIHRDTLREILNLELHEFWPLLDTLIRQRIVVTPSGWFLYDPHRVQS